MTPDVWADVDRYFTDLFVGFDPALDAALVDSAAAGLPPINVSPSQGKFLRLLAEIQGARAILEVGTLGGYSTIWLARGLSPGGHLITLEADPGYAALARRNLARAGLSEIVDVRLGRAEDTLPAMTAEGKGPFDLIFLDADRPNYADHFAWALRLARVGAVIVADNVVRRGAVIDPSTSDPGVRGVRRFNEVVAAEPRVSATVLQTVGGKGYDGFAVLRVVA